VQTNVRRWQPRLRRLADHLERGQHTGSSIAKLEHHPVAKPLDHSPIVLRRRALDDPREARGKVGCSFVAAFLRDAGISRQVEEADRRWTVEGRMGAGRRQRGLEPLEDVLHPRIGFVAVEERQDGLVGESC
jgi:hypothetical protein